jgi:hypothetical protein
MLESWLVASKDRLPNIDLFVCSFANCELRSMVLVDTSMLGSDSPSYNYPGSIPAGLDLPSDAAP